MAAIVLYSFNHGLGLYNRI